MAKIYILREGEEYEPFYNVKAFTSHFSAELAMRDAKNSHRLDCSVDDITPYKIYMISELELED